MLLFFSLFGLALLSLFGRLLFLVLASGAVAVGQRRGHHADRAVPGAPAALHPEAQPQDPGGERRELRLRQLQGVVALLGGERMRASGGRTFVAC